jgi:bacillithiol synthase
MKIQHLAFEKISALSKRDKDYQSLPELFDDFLSFMPTLEGLQKARVEREKFPTNRKLLYEVIASQYEQIPMTTNQKENFESLLDETTFTVITAHQPALLTGPLYYVTKIFSTIVLAKELSTTGQKVIPVFLNGSEDHDFEEINHLNIYNKSITWESDQKGAVGRYSLEGLASVIEQFESILGSSDLARDTISQVKSAFQSAKNYNQFVSNFINLLFGKYGILVVTTDDKRLKAEFSKFIIQEITQQASKELVEKTQAALESKGYKAQAFPREINLFYLIDQKRERIVLEDGQYRVLNTDFVFSEAQILAEVQDNPERFSPNVILRPIYQEVIFPNLAYVGGGGELAYWMERKSQFQYYGVFFPVLIRRNSVMFIQKSHIKTLEKLKLNWEKLFEESHLVIAEYLQSKSSIDLNLNEESREILKLFKAISNKATQVDPTLKDAIEVEKVKTLKVIEQLESRINRAVKKTEEVNVSQINNLYSKIFPDGGLQERTDNFFQYYLAYGNELIDIFLNNLNPLNKDFIIFIDD